MTSHRTSEPRAHHFAPKCWLSGFTDTGDNTGNLWVTDLHRNKQWNTTPSNAGHRRDFYRVSDPGLDPAGFEKQFSKIESDIAPLLRQLTETPRPPSRAELQDLLLFAAIQFVRVPAFRPTILRIADDYYHSRFMKELTSKATWEKALEKSGIALDSPGADYENMLKFEQERRYTLSAENEWYLIRGFEAAISINSLLKQRYWIPIMSWTGSFIASDNPVTMDGPRGEMTGFKTADVIQFPVNQHLLLLSTKLRVRPPRVNFKFIAMQNTFTMLHATEHVYSPVADFCWMDEFGKCQSDWKKFDKAKLSEAPPPETLYLTAI